MKKATVGQCIDKYIYTFEKTNDYKILYIGKCVDVEGKTIIFDKSYYFTIPSNSEMKAFCYDKKRDIEIRNNMELYILSDKEYIETFRTFVQCDGKICKELPAKIIQDND